MTARRYATTRPMPSFTGGDDEPQAACVGNPEPFDVLIDRTDGPASRAAVNAARALCKSCPLGGPDLDGPCLSDNRNEKWARAILGRRNPEPAYVSEQRRANSSEHTRERLNRLNVLVAKGALLEEVLDDLGLSTRHQLYKWCHRHGHLDIWRTLTPHLKANQHRRKEAA